MKHDNTSPSSPSFVVPDWLRACDPEALDQKVRALPGAALIYRAFKFAQDLHQGQLRVSGEPYITHPVAVAGLLQELGGNQHPAMVAAGLLHDVVEDTDLSPEDLEKGFGADVRQLVEGVTKLSKYKFSSKTEREAQNFRRMFLAIAQDRRVILVKLADRLHNMRTLEHLSAEKQQKIALETREIFAPLANLMGMGLFKWEMEDLAFKYLEPEAYREIQALVASKRADRQNQIEQVIQQVRKQLSTLQVIDISGRPKHLYSIYRKMQRQQKEFQEIFDIAALRIIVKTCDDCYRSLSVMHNAFRPIPGRFKDYIGVPKRNGYRSLHTVVVAPWGHPLEVQIRTQEMHRLAEYGVAAHWKYKEVGHSEARMTAADDELNKWVQQLVESQNDLKDDREYLDSIKDNLFDEDVVYVFTPKGDVVPLRRGATPVDFAYRIHTDLGNHCAGSRVNGRMIPLKEKLKNGNIVEIITQKNSHPSLDWLSFVVTSRARNRIRQWYKGSHREENLKRGHSMLEKEMGKSGFESLLKSEQMQTVMKQCNYQTVDDLLVGLGYGEITLNQVVKRLRDATTKAQKTPTVSSWVTDASSQQAKASHKTKEGKTSAKDAPILGVEGLLHHRAKCCNPIPGEAIIGIVSRSNRGIAIHRQECGNTAQVPGDRQIPVSWNSQNPVQTYPVDIQVKAIDRVGVFKDILSRLLDDKVNVRRAQLRDPHHTALISLRIDIQDAKQLERIFARVRKMSDVLEIRRVDVEGSDPDS